MKKKHIDTELLIKKAAPVMRRLRSRLKEGIAMVVLDSATGNGIAVSKEEYTAGLAVRFEINFHFPAHVAAPTKAILSALPKKEVTEIIERIDFKRFTANTITNKEAFLKELKEASENSYAVDRGEFLEDIHCVAAAILDSSAYPVGAIVCSSFSSRLREENFPETALIVRNAAKEIGKSLSDRNRTTNSYAKIVIDQATEDFQEMTNINLDIRRYTEDRNIKYSWFRTKFSELMNISPKQYYLNIKMKKAKQLLSKTDMTVTEIASELGYGTQSNFSNIFKKKTGKFPSDHRSS